MVAHLLAMTGTLDAAVRRTNNLQEDIIFQLIGGALVITAQLYSGRHSKDHQVNQLI